MDLRPRPTLLWFQSHTSFPELYTPNSSVQLNQTLQGSLATGSLMFHNLAPWWKPWTGIKGQLDYILMLPSLEHSSAHFSLFFFFSLHTSRVTKNFLPKKQEPSVVSRKREDGEDGRATSRRRSHCTDVLVLRLWIYLSSALSHQGWLWAPLVVVCITRVQQKPDQVGEPLSWASLNSLQEWTQEQAPETSYPHQQTSFGLGRERKWK